VRRACCAQHMHGVLGQCSECQQFVVVKLGEVGDMPVGTDQQVAGRVGIEVEHRKSQVAAVHDQSGSVLAGLHSAERAFLCVRARRLVLALDVDHPMRGPQSLESVRSAGMGARILMSAGILSHQTWRRAAMSPVISPIAA
jgi:hypothetical protein